MTAALILLTAVRKAPVSCETTAKGQSAGKAGWFAKTPWTVIIQTRDPASPQAAAALERLCRIYWPPIYACLRREGKAEACAQDLTQSFFLRLLERQDLAAVRREKGKFRSFLLASLRHFLADEWDKAHAAKRGGTRSCFSLDGAESEERYRLEPADNMTPDKLYDRRWAMAVLNEAVQRLRAEFQAAGRGDLYEQLCRHLSDGPDGSTGAEAARCLDMAESTLRGWVRRLRLRNRELVREVIAETVASPEQIDEELRHLFESLREL